MPRKKGDARHRILQAFAHLLEMPEEKITTARLARELDVSEASLYRHFPSKKRMYEALLDFIEESVFSACSKIIKEQPDANARTAHILFYLLSFFEKNPGLSRIIHGEAIANEDPLLQKRVLQFFERLETQLRQILRDAEINEGLRTRQTVATSANLLMAVVQGRLCQFVQSRFDKRPTVDWNDQWQQLSSNLFR